MVYNWSVQFFVLGFIFVDASDPRDGQANNDGRQKPNPSVP